MKTLKSLSYFLTICSLSIVLLQCSYTKNTLSKTNALRKCSVELIDVQKYLTTKEQTHLINYNVEMDFEISNPSEQELHLGRYRFDLFANQKHLSLIELDSAIVLKADSNTPLHIKASIAPLPAIDILFKKLRNKPIEYQVKGTFYLKLGQIEYPLQVNLIKHIDG